MRTCNAVLSAALLLGSSSVLANAKPTDEAGWVFTLNLNVGYFGGKSNFSTSDDNKVIEEPLGKPTQSSSATVVYPLGRIQYTTQNQRNQFYLGNTSEQVSNAQFQYELGYIHQFDTMGRVTLAYFPELPLFNTTWEDPYLVGEERTETDEDSQGARIAWQQAFGSPLTFKYAYAKLDVDNEMSGVGQGLTDTQRALLNRDSNAHRFEVETMFPVAKGWFLRPALQATYRDSNGEAVAFDEYTAKLGVLRFAAPHTFIFSLDAGMREYNAENPIFNQTVDENQFSSFLIYDYAGIFGIEKASLNLIAGYSWNQANVDFYDSEALVTSIGMTYRF